MKQKDFIPMLFLIGVVIFVTCIGCGGSSDGDALDFFIEWDNYQDYSGSDDNDDASNDFGNNTSGDNREETDGNDIFVEDDENCPDCCECEYNYEFIDAYGGIEVRNAYGVFRDIDNECLDCVEECRQWAEDENIPEGAYSIDECEY